MRFPSLKITKSLSVRDGHSLLESPTVLVSLWISPRWLWEGPHSDTITHGGCRVLSLFPPVILTLKQACFPHIICAASTSLAGCS